jgi:DNA-binding CsgD family transcriptional regulator
MMLAAADPPGPQAGPLSPRERELVTLVARGRTDLQIAADLFISVRTVRSHLDRIRDKTGCRQRADLTRLALQAGLVQWTAVRLRPGGTEPYRREPGEALDQDHLMAGSGHPTCGKVLSGAIPQRNIGSCGLKYGYTNYVSRYCVMMSRRLPSPL